MKKLIKVILLCVLIVGCQAQGEKPQAPKDVTLGQMFSEFLSEAEVKFDQLLSKAQEDTASAQLLSDFLSEMEAEFNNFLSEAKTKLDQSLSDSENEKELAEKSAAEVETDSLALRQMQDVFVGNPGRDEIKTKLDAALALHGLSALEENYSRAGSCLVTLRKEMNVSEMNILNYMIKSAKHLKSEGVEIKFTFPEAAGVAATFLKAGDK